MTLDGARFTRSPAPDVLLTIRLTEQHEAARTAQAYEALGLPAQTRGTAVLTRTWPGTLRDCE